MDNTTIRREYENYFYVIEAKRDGVKKYVSSKFPRLFQYTVKVNQARRFKTEDDASKFIDDFNYSKYVMEGAIIRKVITKMEVL